MISIAKRASLAAAVALSIAGAGLPAAAQTLETRVAQSVAPMSGLVFIAAQKGLFEKHGLKPAIGNFTSGKQSLNTMIGGGADIATAAEAPITAAAMAGQDIVLVAKMESAGLKTLVSTTSNVKSAADLKGKRIAFTAGTGGEVYVMRLLAGAGLKPQDVTLVNLRPQDMAPAMSAGAIDAYGTWEPNIANGKTALGDKVREIDTQGVYAETFFISVMRPYLEANPKVVQRFLAALIEAETWMKAHPDDAIAIVADTVGMDRKELKGVWNDYAFDVTIDPAMMKILELHAQWRIDSGNRPDGAGMPNFSKFVSTAPLAAVAPERIRLTN